MSRAYRCYDPLNNEPSEAKMFQAFSAEDAAIEYAEDRHSRCAGECDENDVTVIDDTGTSVTFSIEMDWSPNFYAAEKAVTP